MEKRNKAANHGLAHIGILNKTPGHIKINNSDDAQSGRRRLRLLLFECRSDLFSDIHGVVHALKILELFQAVD